MLTEVVAIGTLLAAAARDSIRNLGWTRQTWTRPPRSWHGRRGQHNRRNGRPRVLLLALPARRNRAPGRERIVSRTERQASGRLRRARCRLSPSCARVRWWPTSCSQFPAILPCGARVEAARAARLRTHRLRGVPVLVSLTPALSVLWCRTQVLQFNDQHP